MTTSGMDEKAMPKGVELRLDTLLQGLLTSLPAGTTSLTVGGVTYTVADFITKVKETNMPFKAARAARASLRQLGMSNEQDREAGLDLLTDARAAIASLLGSKNVELTKFGFKPHERRGPKLSAEEKVLRAAKAKLTREKRHTMGSRQKAEVRQTETPSVAIGPDGSMIVTAPVEKPANGADQTGGARTAV